LLLRSSSWRTHACIIYDNYPLDGNTVGRWISPGSLSWVSDSFTIGSPVTLNAVNIGAWVQPGETFQSIQREIGTTTFGDEVASGSASLTNTFLFTNSHPYNVYPSSFILPGVTLGSGAYWLTLRDAATAYNTGIWWDQKDGLGAAHNSVGPLPGSNAVQLAGEAAVPEPATVILFGAAPARSSRAPAQADTAITWPVRARSNARPARDPSANNSSCPLRHFIRH
jgi:hypothetical protein